MIKLIKSLESSIQSKDLFKNKVISKFNLLKTGYGKLTNLSAKLIDKEIAINQFVDELSQTELKLIDIPQIDLPQSEISSSDIFYSDLEKKQLNECFKKAISLVVKNS